MTQDKKITFPKDEKLCFLLFGKEYAGCNETGQTILNLTNLERKDVHELTNFEEPLPKGPVLTKIELERDMLEEHGKYQNVPEILNILTERYDPERICVIHVWRNSEDSMRKLLDQGENPNDDRPIENRMTDHIKLISIENSMLKQINTTMKHLTWKQIDKTHKDTDTEISEISDFLGMLSDLMNIRMFLHVDEAFLKFITQFEPKRLWDGKAYHPYVDGTTNPKTICGIIDNMYDKTYMEKYDTNNVTPVGIWLAKHRNMVYKYMWEKLTKSETIPVMTYLDRTDVLPADNGLFDKYHRKINTDAFWIKPKAELPLNYPTTRIKTICKSLNPKFAKLIYACINPTKETIGKSVWLHEDPNDPSTKAHILWTLMALARYDHMDETSPEFIDPTTTLIIQTKERTMDPKTLTHQIVINATDDKHDSDETFDLVGIKMTADSDENPFASIPRNNILQQGLMYWVFETIIADKGDKNNAD